MRLADALSGEDLMLNEIGDLGEETIHGITCDSRQVKPGFLFAAFKGCKANGNLYIAEAISKGALAVIVEENLVGALSLENKKCIFSENPRRTYALIASKFFGAMPNTIAAVTGTNGKTSTVHFLQQISVKLKFVNTVMHGHFWC